MHIKQSIHKVVLYFGRHIDFRMGLLGAFMMSIPVFYINYMATGFGFLTFTAAIKQWFYTFFFSGLVMKSCEKLAVKFQSKPLSIFLAVLLPSVSTLLLTFIIHSFEGTPRPFESTLPTLIVFSGTLFWALKKRNDYDKKHNKKST